MPASPGFDVSARSAAEPNGLGVVLFDVPGERLASLVADLRRLSRQSIQFRWLPAADDDANRVLVRVESPPLLVVSRMADPTDTGRTYSEQAPGVWVEFGYRISRTDIP